MGVMLILLLVYPTFFLKGVILGTFQLVQISTIISTGTPPPPPKTKMTIKHPPFEDVFPIKNEDFPMSCLFSGV